MMLLSDLIQALDNLRAQKTRTILTASGIVFGVGSVIGMMAIGSGAREESLRFIEQLGVRNILEGTALKAMPDRIQLRWRGQLLEAVNSPTHSYLPEPGTALAFFIRPEHVRLIRKDRSQADASHHMNLMAGEVVREEDCGTTWTLYFRLDTPGAPAQGDYDLEIEVPRMVYEILEIARDRRWQLSIHRGSMHVLPA